MDNHDSPVVHVERRTASPLDNVDSIRGIRAILAHVSGPVGPVGDGVERGDLELFLMLQVPYINIGLLVFIVGTFYDRERREKHTSLHQYIPAAQLQLTRPQLFGPGPFLGFM